MRAKFISYANLLKFMQKIPSDENMSSTNVRIDVKTRDRIARHGKYGDSMDTILNRILDFYEKHQDKKPE